MRVSLITVVYQAKDTIADAIQSVFLQQYPDIEYIVVDGGSVDGTLEIIQSFADKIDAFISEPDGGMYDALNKGIAMAKGEIVGILNADDMLASPDVISEIVAQFKKTNADGVYGNLHYVQRDKPNQIIRKWKSKQVSSQAMAWGWMPAHPSLYLKKELFESFGNYSLDFGSAADYELMLRFLYRNKIKVAYLDKLLVNMRVGGMSNQSVKHRKNALQFDWQILKRHKVPWPIIAIVIKKISKLKQFF